jgi:hypothetical protein
MNYLTPELVARSRSEDETIAEAAGADWERACEEYNQRVDALRPKLPKGVRTLLDRLYLHDARVLALAVEEAPVFSIFLQLDNPPKKLVELKYSLAAPPKLLRHTSLAGDGKPLQWWLYDEIDVLEEGPVSVIKHSILLTGGWELQLLFSNLRCKRLRRIVLPPGGTPTDETLSEPELLGT